jgi:putative membrane protein
MIQGYADHAANERTFLAWVRTGVAVIGFGFVIEKFNLFLLSLLDLTSLDPIRRSQLERLSGPSTPYQGLALIVVGIVLLIVATVRLSAPKGCSRTRTPMQSPGRELRFCCRRLWWRS